MEHVGLRESGVLEVTARPIGGNERVLDDAGGDPLLLKGAETFKYFKLYLFVWKNNK